VSSPNTDLRNQISAFSATISNQPLGLAQHRPELWGLHTSCFENVRRKVRLDGGRGKTGWMFLSRRVADIPGAAYLIAVHHAVWHAPNGDLIDVTPFHPDEKHRPLCPGDGVLFLVDDKALPFTTDKLIAPLPSRFFALTADERLTEHLRRLTDEEQQACQRIYDGLPS
jgi:hypothetical protein